MSVCVAMAAIAACGPAAPAENLNFASGPMAYQLRRRAGPNLLFHEKEKPGVDDGEDQHAKAEALAFLEFRFGGPHQEGSNILAVLRNRLGRAVRVVDKTVARRLGHGDLVARRRLGRFNPSWFESEDFARFSFAPLPHFTRSPWRGRNRPPINMAFTLFAHHAAGGAVAPFNFVGRLTLTLGCQALGPDH